VQFKNMTRMAVGLASFALVLAACGGSEPVADVDDTSSAPAASAFKIGIAYDIAGRGDGGFNDLAYNGVKQLADETGAELKELTAKGDDTDDDRAERLRVLAQSGFNPIIGVGFTYAGPMTTVAAEFPEVSFGIVDDGSVQAPNVTGLVFAEEQGSFLVGVAAGLKTKSNNVGFIGGVNIPLIKKFEAGFAAGVKAANPSAKVQVTYLSNPPDFSGFNDPAKGGEAALGMFDAGADIVYAAAGGSGAGLFQVATQKGKLAIGVDADQYNTADEKVREVIMTSMLKNVNVATYAFAKSVLDGSPVTGTQVFDLNKGGVGYSLTNGKVDDIKDQIDAYAEKIKSGEIVVPTS
jgi:basic membrane protein A and related proteins